MQPISLRDVTFIYPIGNHIQWNIGSINELLICKKFISGSERNQRPVFSFNSIELVRAYILLSRVFVLNFICCYVAGLLHIGITTKSVFLYPIE